MFDARKGQITITRGDTGLLAIVPTGYVPTSQDRMFFMVAEMPDGRIVINKTVTPDDDGVCKLMFSGTDTENLSKRHREYTYAIRFALDVTESNGKITGYREMITPEPPGCFVVLEANGCPACTCETQNVGSMEVKLESFRGPKGDRGEKRDKGDRGAKGEPGKDAVIDADSLAAVGALDLIAIVVAAAAVVIVLVDIALEVGEILVYFVNLIADNIETLFEIRNAHSHVVKKLDDSLDDLDFVFLCVEVETVDKTFDISNFLSNCHFAFSFQKQPSAFELRNLTLCSDTRRCGCQRRPSRPLR